MPMNDPDGFGITQQGLIQLRRQLFKRFFRGLPPQINAGKTRRRRARWDVLVGQEPSRFR